MPDKPKKSEQRSDKAGEERNPPGGGAAPQGNLPPLFGVSLSPIDWRSDAILQLEGFGEMLHGAGRFLLTAADLLKSDSSALPEKEVGEYSDDYDYEKHDGHLVRVKNRKKVDCKNTVLIDWRDYRIPLTGPKDCSKLTGEQVQSILNQQIEAAKQAAARLCTDPHCKNAHTTLVYQFWDCIHNIDPNTNQEVFALLVVIQLELQCRPYS